MAAKKKSTAKKSSRTKAAAATVDPREPVEPTPKHLDATRAELAAVLEKLTPPEQPQRGDLVEALIHAHFVEGHCCGLAQEVLRRIESGFVDRNEFRISEAFEVAEVLEGLDLPERYERCRALHEAVQQVYNDQNGVSLDYLREASMSERKSFFQRVPAITPWVAGFLGRYVDWEEVAFSERSTQRVQVRLGFDPKDERTRTFVDELRRLLAPFGHLPLSVGPPLPSGRPRTDPYLCPTCLLARLGAKGK